MVSGLIWLIGFLMINVGGGSALGTTPTAGTYYVVMHEHHNPVPEISWLANLAVSWTSLCAPFIASWIALPYRNRYRPVDGSQTADEGVSVAKAYLVLTSITTEAFRSLSAYLMIGAT